MILCDDEIESLHETLKSVIRAKYGNWCRTLRWNTRDINEWADSVAGEGIALGLSEIEKWNPERGSLSAWLYLRTCTVARDELRALEAAKRKGELEYREFDESEHESHDPFQGLHQRGELREILERLKPAQREALVLYEYIGLKVPEIALLFKCPVKTVYTHLSRAKKKASLFRGEGLDSEDEGAGAKFVRPPPAAPEPEAITKHFPSRRKSE